MDILTCVRKPLNAMTENERRRICEHLEIGASGSGFDERVAEALRVCFQCGPLGIADHIKGLDDDYGVQLDVVIEKFVAPRLNVVTPVFALGARSISGAVEREGWLKDALLGAMLNRSPEEVAPVVQEILRRNKWEAWKTSGLAGGVVGLGTAARAILGSRFDCFIRQVAGAMAPMSFGGTVALQRASGILFGPLVGWVLSAALLVSTISAGAFPREMNKYIPAVFLIALKRAGMTSLPYNPLEPLPWLARK